MKIVLSPQDELFNMQCDQIELALMATGLRFIEATKGEWAGDATRMITDLTVAIGELHAIHRAHAEKRSIVIEGVPTGSNGDGSGRVDVHHIRHPDAVHSDEEAKLPTVRGDTGSTGSDKK